jgi:hypothetical protein
MHRLQNCYGQCVSFMKIDLSPTFGAKFVQRLLVKKIKISLKFHFLCKYIGKKKIIFSMCNAFKSIFYLVKDCQHAGNELLYV